MRLEQLFQQLDHFLERDSVWDSRGVIAALLDVVTLFSRNDLKSEVLKELDRNSAALSRMARSEDVDPAKLKQLLERLDSYSRMLYATPGKIGISLSENELFKSIAQRSTIPGGTCSFDLPAFHYWLQLEDRQRKQCLELWVQPFRLILSAIDTLLNFLRTSAIPTSESASAGFFQKTLDHTLSYQLLRVGVRRETECYAEISGGKHRFTVRFMKPDGVGGRPVQCSEDVPFQLTCCLI